jgi:hypothetical protein
VEHADGSGEFVFSGRIVLDLEEEEEHRAVEVLVLTRWDASGRGRSDVRVGGEAERDEYEVDAATQCWRSTGDLAYDAIEGKRKGEEKKDKKPRVVIKSTGKVEDCPFLEAADAVLPSRPAEPPAPALPAQAI